MRFSQTTGDPKVQRLGEGSVGREAHGTADREVGATNLRIGSELRWRRAWRRHCCLLDARRLRQCEVERHPPTQLALCPDAAAMGLHNMLDDGQAQPRPSGLSRTRLVDAVEALEDALQVL